MPNITVSNNNNSNIIQINTPGPQGPTGPTGPTGSVGPTGSSLPFSNISGDIWATTSSIQFSGSVNSLSGFTGSLLGTSTSASFSSTSSYVNSLTQSLNISGSLTAISFTGSLLGTSSVALDVANRFWRNGLHGTTFNGGVNQITYSQLIPANTFGDGDIIEIIYKGDKTGINGVFSLRIYINPSGIISGSPVAELTSLANTQIYLALSRFGNIKSNTMTEFVNTGLTTLNTDITNSIVAASDSPINWSINNTVVFAIQGSNASDTVHGSMFIIRRI